MKRTLLLLTIITISAACGIVTGFSEGETEAYPDLDPPHPHLPISPMSYCLRILPQHTNASEISLVGHYAPANLSGVAEYTARSGW